MVASGTIVPSPADINGTPQRRPVRLCGPAGIMEYWGSVFMRKQLVLTASGKDRPGILEEVTGLIVRHHGNVDLLV